MVDNYSTTVHSLKIIYCLFGTTCKHCKHFHAIKLVNVKFTITLVQVNSFSNHNILIIFTPQAFFHILLPWTCQFFPGPASSMSFSLLFVQSVLHHRVPFIKVHITITPPTGSSMTFCPIRIPSHRSEFSEV